MSYFIRNANTFRVAAEESMDLHQKLPVGNYTVNKDMFENLFLEMVDGFEMPPKLYGDTTKNAKRILNTFNSRSVSTGVMLAGEKGSGKSLLAKMLSVEGALQGIPTIIINQPWTGDKFNKFMQDIEQPCIVLFDEFEKVYDGDDQEAALTLLDGVFPSKKLFIITCNDKWRINEHMRNRPGRIFYMLDYKGLEAEFIREYCNDCLNDKQHIERIAEIAALFEQFNFDMLKALVEEMNRYGETPQEALKMLNVKAEYNNNSRYDVQLWIGGKEVVGNYLTDKVWHGNPLTGSLHIEWDPDPEGDLDYKNCRFNASHIKHVDADKGKFEYINELGERVVLTRQQQSQYNYLAF